MVARLAAVVLLSSVLLSSVLVSSFCGCRTVPDFTTAGAPPGDYGRPGIVRGAARAGSYAGATVGIAVWVVTWLPVQALTAVVDEPLGYSGKEWTYLPLTASAAVGHYAFGLPAEALHWLFWGAWVDEPVPVGFEHIPGSAADLER